MPVSSAYRPVFLYFLPPVANSACRSLLWERYTRSAKRKPRSRPECRRKDCLRKNSRITCWLTNWKEAPPSHSGKISLVACILCPMRFLSTCRPMGRANMITIGTVRPGEISSELFGRHVLLDCPYQPERQRPPGGHSIYGPACASFRYYGRRSTDRIPRLLFLRQKTSMGSRVSGSSLCSAIPEN
jgi:hypothetical protein